VTLPERAPRIRGRLHPSVMHFYSGPPMHLLSGVDRVGGNDTSQLVSSMIWVLKSDQPKPAEFTPAMGESTGILPGLPAVAGKPVHVCLLSSIAAYTVSQGFGWHVCTRHDLGSI